MHLAENYINRDIAISEATPQSYVKCVSLFSNLRNDDLAYFEKNAQLRSLKKGKIIYIQSEPAQHFFVMKSGWVKLFYTTAEGEEIIVDMLTTGHVFGESAIFENNMHTSTAQVVQDVELLSIPSKILAEQINCNPDLAFNMLSSMSRQHRYHSRTLAFNAMLNAPQRVGCFMLRLCPAGCKKAAVFELPYDKTLIASTLGMKGATFSRALNVLRQKISIDVRGSTVEIASVKQLAEYVYGSLAEKFVPDISSTSAAN